MSPVNRCSLFINRCLTFITTSMTFRGAKLGGGHADQSAGVLGIVLRAPFLGSSKVCLTLLGQRERLSCMAYHEHAHVMCIRFLLQDVHRFKSSRLSNISN
jgi:hypothetical protein